MNKEKEQKSSWLIYSIVLHSIVIVALLLSLNETYLIKPQKKPAPIILIDDKKRNEKQEKRNRTDIQKKEPEKPKPLDPKTFTVPAPVMYYGHEIDPNKKPGNPTEKKIETSHDKSIDNSNEKNIPSSESNTLPLSIKPEEKLETLSNKEDLIVDKNSTVADTIIDKNIFIDYKKPINLKRTRNRSIIPSSDTQQPSVKKLTLSDLFKKSPLVSTETQIIGEGSGQPIVIKEGDMKYYSVWTKFLHHLNQTARFNRIKKKIPLIEWIKTGQLKKDLFCGITVTKEGKVLSIDIISSSGFKPFDALCIEDIWASSPFPPLPESMGKEQARFEVRSYL